VRENGSNKKRKDNHSSLTRTGRAKQKRGRKYGPATRNARSDNNGRERGRTTMMRLLKKGANQGEGEDKSGTRMKGEGEEGGRTVGFVVIPAGPCVHSYGGRLAC